jgi:hypothetical protein
MSRINDFTPETRELFDQGGWADDWEDDINDADCLHHIMKRISNSPYNACPLNNFRNHQPEGRSSQDLPALHSEEATRKYLRKTKEYLDSIGYEPNEKDKEFLLIHKRYY